jgi:hypothetical protein
MPPLFHHGEISSVQYRDILQNITNHPHPVFRMPLDLQQSDTVGIDQLNNKLWLRNQESSVQFMDTSLHEVKPFFQVHAFSPVAIKNRDNEVRRVAVSTKGNLTERS